MMNHAPSPSPHPGPTPGRHTPASTYRFQLNAGFPLENARRLLPYLDALGVGDVYLSPVFRARPGSTHGYDAIDPTAVSPELGGDAAFRSFCHEARQRGMGVLLDIVPNHMAASEQGPWWRDVLEHGRSSPFARHFDVFWPTDPAEPYRILLPVLGRPYDEAREAGELALGVAEAGLVVTYADRDFPLDPATWSLALGGSPPPPLAEALAALERLPPREPPDPARCDTAEPHRARVVDLLGADDAVRARVSAALERASAERAQGGRLDRVLAAQAYQLDFWRLAGDRMSYRRFFDITDLIGVRVEDPGIFEATHSRLFDWVREDLVTGVRVDHVDGLYDPTDYLRRLRSRLDEIAGESGRPPAYLVVEKILGGTEMLPEEWPVDGTTGYDFLDSVNDVFVHVRGLGAIDEVWTRLTEMRRTFDELVYQKKKLVLDALFSGELSELASGLEQAAREVGEPSAAEALRAAVAEATAVLPVYRTYVRVDGIEARDRALIEAALAAARATGKTQEGALSVLRRVLLLQLPAGAEPAMRARWLHIVLRWQQLTGPAMAKGLEDTALYVYSRLISLNVVGGDPGDEQRSLRDFHHAMRRRAARWPTTMSTTSTHDSKRGEDTRARIHVLSELPAEWERRLLLWRELNAPLRSVVDGAPVPEPAEEVLLYQTLLGAWPLEPDAHESFAERMREYVVKAAREAKVRTSWTEQNEAYEQALVAFLDRLLEHEPFLEDMLPFQRRIAGYGAVNGLSQLVIKATAPGTPDIYRGTELWDLSLVDPDNRRPVDFERREHTLQDLESLLRERGGRRYAALLARWADGSIKLAVTATVLRLRRERQALFRVGAYVPLIVTGTRANNVCAFGRSLQGAWSLTVATRLPARLWPDGAPGPAAAWSDTTLVLPEGAPTSWTDTLTGARLKAAPGDGGAELRLADVLDTVPVAILGA